MHGSTKLKLSEHVFDQSAPESAKEQTYILHGIANRNSGIVESRGLRWAIRVSRKAKIE